mmetsp:Transcript_2986/g.5351  ORF Transcript_2986/g.5351 Transcript_2986/m.5351 type:complete len:436 (-) Transcript_2986:221-1528(-)
MVLTTKQKDELHKAILDYLILQNFTSTSEQFQKEAEVATDPSTSGLLEKKWTSVLRLQKKITDLEAKVEQLTEDLKNATPGSKGSKPVSDKLPRAPPTHALTGHRGTITQVAFHPVFSYLVSACEDASVKVWDSDTAALERTLKGHTSVVNDIAFDNVGNLLATCSADLSIKLWDVETWNCTKTLNGHEHNVSSVCFTSSGDHLISASRDKTIRIWEVQTGFCIKTLRGHDDWVRRAIASPDGVTLASCSNDQSIKLWNFQTGACTATLTGHDHVIECLAFSNAGTAAALAGASLPTVASLPNGSSAKAPSPTPGSASSLKPTAESGAAGTFLVSGSRDKTMRLWDLTTTQCRQVFKGHDNWVKAVLFHPTGKFIISCSDDKSIRVWDVTSGKCIRTLAEAHPHFVSCLAFNSRANPAQLASGSVDQTVHLWECK